MKFSSHWCFRFKTITVFLYLRQGAFLFSSLKQLNTVLTMCTKGGKGVAEKFEALKKDLQFSLSFFSLLRVYLV